MIRSILLSLVLLASLDAEAVPKLSLVNAMRAAEAYVAKHKIPNAHRYLASVDWQENFQQPEKSCWTVTWLPLDSGMSDALLVVRVYEDGRITYQDSWA